MTENEARWLAGAMTKEGWPDVWIEPGVSPGDWRVAFRRLPDESPRHAAVLSKAIRSRCARELARGATFAPVQVLTREEAAERSRLDLDTPAPIFRGEPLHDGEILHETSLPCPRCEDEGRRTRGGQTPRLCRREDGDLVCHSHGDLYTEVQDALNRRPG